MLSYCIFGHKPNNPKSTQYNTYMYLFIVYLNINLYEETLSASKRLHHQSYDRKGAWEMFQLLKTVSPNKVHDQILQAQTSLRS